MMAVPRRPRRPADGEAKTPVNGTLELPMMPSAASENGSVPHPPAPPATDLAVPARTEKIEAHPATGPGPHLAADPGLYAVLGLDPSVPDALIQTTYRRQASRLQGSGSNDNAALRQLNVAYEVLGNSVRRAEYDRMRLTQSSSGPPTQIRPGAKAATRVTRRRRPRHAVQPRYAGLGDVLVVLVVVVVAILAGAFIILPRLSFNLSALNALQNVLPLSNSSRRVIDTTVTARKRGHPVTPRQAASRGLRCVGHRQVPHHRRTLAGYRQRQDRWVGRGHDLIQRRRGHAQLSGPGSSLCPGRRSAVVVVDDLHPALA